MPPRLRAVLAALLVSGPATLFAVAGPARSAEFTDSAGRHVDLPARIERILPGERNAEVLVYVLAPEKLAALERLSGGARIPGGTRPPVLTFTLDSTPDTVAAAARDYRADLIIDAGPVAPDRAAFADAVQQRSGVPYILVDSSFERTPAVLAGIGAMLGVRERGEELELFAEQALRALRGRLLVLSPTRRPHVYYALGRDGLTTALPGSAVGAPIDEAGAFNVAAPLGRGTLARISRDQLLGWNPEIIIAADRRFYDAVRRDRAWRALSAVRNNRVYLEPGSPFGWIENPSGVNRLIGLHWLSILLYPGLLQADLRGTTCDFYDKFYHVRLTNGQLENMLGPAGVPPPDIARQLGYNLPSLTGAPTLPMPAPGVTGGAPAQAAPELPDQRNALCTIPGIAAPIDTIPGPAVPPGLPGPRLRQPGAGGLPGRTPPPQ